MKNIKRFFSDWAEVCILLPLATAAVLFGDKVLRNIDPTISWLDAGTLSVLLFNFVCLTVIFGFSYFIYRLNFNDYFEKNWTKNLSPTVATIANLLLWFGTLGISAFVLLKNL